MFLCFGGLEFFSFFCDIAQSKLFRMSEVVSNVLKLSGTNYFLAFVRKSISICGMLCWLVAVQCCSLCSLLRMMWEQSMSEKQALSFSFQHYRWTKKELCIWAMICCFMLGRLLLGLSLGYICYNLSSLEPGSSHAKGCYWWRVLGKGPGIY